MGGQLLGKNRNAKVACLNTVNHTELENCHDFLHRRTRPQCILDVPPHAGGIHASVGRLESNTEQLNILNSLWCKSGYVGKNLCGIHKLRS